MQHSVTIRAESEPGGQVVLSSGESAVFGSCACGACRVDLVVGAGLAWWAGKVAAANHQWLLTNLMQQRSLLVENLENPHEYLTVTPRRRDAPIAFELARVCAADDPHGPRVTVFGPEPGHVTRPPRRCPAAAPYRRPLDPDSTYFAVLQALCEPRLRGSPLQPLPTSEEIARRLRAKRVRISPRAVDAHIEYLGEKLGLGRGVRRDVVVASAIRRGLIRVG